MSEKVVGEQNRRRAQGLWLNGVSGSAAATLPGYSRGDDGGRGHHDSENYEPSPLLSGRDLTTREEGTVQNGELKPRTKRFLAGNQGGWDAASSTSDIEGGILLFSSRLQSLQVLFHRVS